MSKLNAIWLRVRHEWLLHFFYLITNWLPDNVMFIRLRGRLFGWCLGSCGKRFGVGRNVTFYNAKHIHIGNDVYVAYGCWFNGAGSIFIEDEVLIGPYCVFDSSNHQYDKLRQSFRFMPGKNAPIRLGKGSWLGSHVTVTAGSIVNSPGLVAANSVVIKSTDPGSLYGGVPCKLIRKL